MSTTSSSISPSSLVGQIVAAQPLLARVFERVGIDYCCGGKRTLADSSAALIRLAGRGATMAPRYAQMVRTVVAESIHVARDAGETTTAELDRIAQSRGVRATYSELAAEADAAKTSLETLNAARRLHAWTGDMIRATR